MRLLLVVLATLALALRVPAGHAAPPEYLRSIDAPGAVAVSVGPDGDLYVLDQRPRVTRMRPDGQFVLAWNPLAGMESPGTQALGVEASAAGDVFVSVTGGGYPGRIRVFGQDGVLSSEILEDHTGDPLKTPWGMYSDPQHGLFVIDYGHAAVLRWDGEFLYRLLFGRGCNPAHFWGPTGVAEVDGQIYVTEFSDRLTRYGVDGTYLSEVGTTAGCGQTRAYPRMVTADGNGRLVVCDALTDRVTIVSTSGAVLETWGGTGSGSGEFRIPLDVAVGKDGLIYVVDSGNQRVQVFGEATTATVSTTWGRIKTIYR